MHVRLLIFELEIEVIKFELEIEVIND